MKTKAASLVEFFERNRRIKLSIQLLIGLITFEILSAIAQEKIVDLPADPSTITIQTASGEKSTENVADVWANYPKLRDSIKAEEAKKLATEDEITAQRRFTYISSGTQKIDIPKDAADKHKARFAKFVKAREDALNGAVKKAGEPLPKIDSKSSVQEIAAFVQALNDQQILVMRAKAKKDELVAAGVPIADSVQKAVDASQPKKVSPTPAPTPNDGL